MKHIAEKVVATVLVTATTASIPLFTHQYSDSAVLLDNPPSIEGMLLLSQGNSLMPTTITPVVPDKIVRTMAVIVTAYSSTPEQTDDTPFITAAGTQVRDGIVAANFLPFGTKIKLPALYGNKIFVVEDRMHPRKQGIVDIWFPGYWEAKEFGAQDTYIEIIEG